ncbi:MAG: Ig domain protein [Clostridiales bacterium]|jgi:hypothetical protein|nr:Ig domain protein [Clostridiales bacterium]
MNKLKKLLVILIAVVMCIPTLSISSSAETINDEKALRLYQLGLFSGQSSISYVPYLEGETDREQAMIMLSKIFGWQLLGSENCTFLDVSDWAKSAVATAYDRGVTSGIGNGRFGGNSEVTERQVISWITRELGYENPYNNIFIARQIGLIDYATAVRIDSDIKNKAEKTLIRDDIVEYFYASLLVKPNGSDKTLIEQIIAVKPSLQSKAEEFGLVSKLQKQLAVKDIVVSNYYEVAVTYTGTINEETVLQKDNYIINNNNVVDVTLENNTAILLMKSKIERQGNMVVTVKKEVGIPSDKQVILSNIIDSTPPTVTKIETVKKDVIEITFSEPIFTAEKPTVKINNGEYYCIVAQPVGRKVKVQLSSSVPPNSNNEIKVSGARDYESLIMQDYAGSFIYKVDVEPVTISVKGQVTPNKLTIVLDKEIKNALTVDDFYWGNPNNKPDQVFKINETTYDLLFLKYPIAPQYEQELFVLSSKLETYWGIKTQTTVAIKIRAYADDIPPVILKNNIKDNRDVVLYFSEELEPSSAINGVNYVIKDSNNKIVTDSRVQVYDNASKTVTIRFINAIQGGKYTILVQNIEDISALRNKIVTTTIETMIPDTTPPVVVKAEAIVADKTIFITFSEEVNGTAYVLKNWVLGNNFPILIENASEPRTLKLTFADRIIDGQALQMGQIEDLMGNKIKQLSTTVVWTKMGYANLISSKTVSNNQLELVVDGVLASGIEAQNFRLLDNNGVAKEYIAKAVIKDIVEGKTTLLLTTTFDMQFSSSKVSRGISVMPETIKTEKGNFVSSEMLYTIRDGIAPTVLTTSGNALINRDIPELIRIKFDEGLTPMNQVYFATDIIIEINGSKLIPGNDYSVEMRADSSSSDTAVIKLSTGFNKGKYVQAGDIVKIYVQNPNYLKDASGNLVKDFTIEKTVR